MLCFLMKNIYNIQAMRDLVTELRPLQRRECNEQRDSTLDGAARQQRGRLVDALRAVLEGIVTAPC